MLRSPVCLYCDLQSFGSYNDHCYILNHDRVVVNYSLWHRLGRDVLVCVPRMLSWNNEDRYRESRLWVWVYVYLLNRHPELGSLCDLFREWARLLVWPRYEVVKEDEKE